MKHFFHSPLLAPKNHEQLKGEKNFSRSRKLPPATLPAPPRSAREHGALYAGKRVSNAKGDKTSRLCQMHENMLFEESEFKSKSTCTDFKEIYSLVRLFAAGTRGSMTSGGK